MNIKIKLGSYSESELGVNSSFHRNQEKDRFNNLFGRYRKKMVEDLYPIQIEEK